MITFIHLSKTLKYKISILVLYENICHIHFRLIYFPYSAFNDFLHNYNPARTLRTSTLMIIVTLFIVIIVIFKNTYKFTANEENGVVKIHYVDNISTAQEKIINEFNKENTGKIEVVPVNLPFSKFTTNERKEIIARSLRSKNERMDIFAIDIIWGPRFAKWSFPLDKYFDDIYLKRFWGHTIESCIYNEQLIALPLYTDIGLLFYRKDLLEKIGISDSTLLDSITWDDFLKLGERFKNTPYPFFIFAGANFEGMICSFHEALPVYNSKEIFNNKTNLNNDGAHKSLQLMVDLIHKYKYSPKEILEYDENKSKIYALEKDAVFIRGWPGFFRDEQEAGQYPQKLKNYRVTALPHWAGEQKNAVYGGWNLMISKYSKHKDEAVQFLKYMVSEKSQRILSERGYFPSLRSIYNDPDFTEDNTLKLYFNLLKNGKHRPFLENYTQVSDIMAHYLHKALKKEISVEQALSLATEKINTRRIFIK